MPTTPEKTFAENHAALRDAMKAKGVSPFIANQVAVAVLEGRANQKALDVLVSALQAD